MSDPQKDSKSQPVHEDEYLPSFNFFPELDDVLKEAEAIENKHIDEWCRAMAQAARSNPWKVDKNHWDAWRGPDE